MPGRKLGVPYGAPSFPRTSKCEVCGLPVMYVVKPDGGIWGHMATIDQLSVHVQALQSQGLNVPFRHPAIPGDEL